MSGTTSRARLVVADKQTPVGIAPSGTTTSDPYIDQALPDGTGERTLVIGATADAGWRAVAVSGSGDPVDLAPVAGPGLLDWAQGYAVPEGTPTVTVRFDSTSRQRWLAVQAIALLALVVMALPERRREDPDPDLDDDSMNPEDDLMSPDAPTSDLEVPADDPEVPADDLEMPADDLVSAESAAETEADGQDQPTQGGEA